MPGWREAKPRDIRCSPRARAWRLRRIRSLGRGTAWFRCLRRNEDRLTGIARAVGSAEPKRGEVDMGEVEGAAAVSLAGEAHSPVSLGGVDHGD
jgi:hypothetical protein